MLKGHAWACLHVCAAWCMLEATHTLTLFGGLGIGAFGGRLGGGDCERVRLALAAAIREQTCRRFGHGGESEEARRLQLGVYGSCLDHVPNWEMPRC
jgi:hypothetical protein